MKRLPFLGQLLGRLCWNPYVTVCGEWSFWTTCTQSLVGFTSPKQIKVIMMVIILAWCIMRYVVVYFFLQIQAEGCCLGVFGDCTQSVQAVLWRKKPTSGYGYALSILNLYQWLIQVTNKSWSDF